MFGIPLIYLKLGGWLLFVAAIYGGYRYVDNLRDTVLELRTEKTQLEDMNETLTDSIAELQRMSEVRDEISTISREIREKNIVIKESREEVINDSVAKGNDREVGPLLREFFNSK